MYGPNGNKQDFVFKLSKDLNEEIANRKNDVNLVREQFAKTEKEMSEASLIC